MQSSLRQITKTAGEKPPRQMPREKPALRKRSPGGGGYPLLVWFLRSLFHLLQNKSHLKYKMFLYVY